MTRDRTYTNLTVNRTRLETVRKTFETDKFFGNQTFVSWVMDIIESSYRNTELMKNIMKNFSMGSIEGTGSVIFDSNNESFIRVFLDNDDLICSEHKTEPCNHKVFAVMHPKWKEKLG